MAITQHRTTRPRPRCGSTIRSNGARRLWARRMLFAIRLRMTLKVCLHQESVLFELETNCLLSMQCQRLLPIPLLEATVRPRGPPMPRLPRIVRPQRRSTDRRLNLHQLPYFRRLQACVQERCPEIDRSLCSIWAC